MKNQKKILAGKLKLSKVLEKLQILLMVDFITKLLLVAGKNMILAVYNRLYKITHFIAIIEETSVEELVCFFRDNMWKLHELSKSMVLDREPQFAVELTKKLNRILRIKT